MEITIRPPITVAHWRYGGVAAILALTCFGGAAQVSRGSGQPPTSSPAVPRYGFKVGQELLYTLSFAGDHAGSHRSEAGSVRVWVTQQNADDSWRLYASGQGSVHALRDGNRFSDGSTNSWFRVDVFDDGHIASEWRRRARPEVLFLFPRLPATNAQVASGWRGGAPGVDWTDFTVGPAVVSAGAPAGDSFIFCGESHRPADAIQLVKNSGTYTFDRHRGLVAKCEFRFSQGFGRIGAGEGVAALAEVSMHPADETARIAARFEAYFSAKEDYDAVIAEAMRAPGGAESRIAGADRGVEAARRAAGQSPAAVAPDAPGTWPEIASTAPHEAETRRSRVIDRPSPEWQVADLSGKSQSIAAYRGKVIVLAFWNRNCEACIDAMPQLNQLAQSRVAFGAAVLGISTDADAADAQLVSEKMSLLFPTVRAAAVADGYGVRTCPTFVIIDQSGIVRVWREGYSSQSFREMEVCVDALIAKAAERRVDTARMSLWDRLVEARKLKAAADVETISLGILYLRSKRAGRLPNESDFPKCLTEPDEVGGEGILDVSTWHGGKLLDPWNNPYVYKRSGSGFEVISYGADGKPGGEGENADIRTSEPKRE